MVKYADGPTTEVSIEIAAPVADIWALATDPTIPARFSSELQEANWNPDGPAPGVGAEIIGRNRMAAMGEWTTTSYVTIWDERKELSWAVGDREAPAATWWFLIGQDSESGRAMLTQRVRLGPGRSGLSGVIANMPDEEDRIVASRLASLQSNMARNLEAIQALAEGTRTIEQLVTEMTPPTD